MTSFSFEPIPDATAVITANAVSDSVMFTQPIADSASHIRVYNAGPNVAYIRISKGKQAATVKDMPLAPGSVEYISKSGKDSVSVVTKPLQSAVVSFTPCNR